MKTCEWALLILIVLKLVGFLQAPCWLVFIPAYICMVVGFVPAFVRGYKQGKSSAEND